LPFLDFLPLFLNFFTVFSGEEFSLRTTLPFLWGLSRFVSRRYCIFATARTGSAKRQRVACNFLHGGERSSVTRDASLGQAPGPDCIPVLGVFFFFLTIGFLLVGFPQRRHLASGEEGTRDCPDQKAHAVFSSGPFQKFATCMGRGF